MKQVVIINQSTDPAITNDVLLQIAEALSIQNARDFAPVWDGVIGPDGIAIDAKATFSVAEADAGLPVGAIPCLVQDTLDYKNALGYHDVEGPVDVIRLGWGAIKANGGSLLAGSNALSVTASHEVCELLADCTANNWVPTADGKKVAYETADPVEGNSYHITVKGVESSPATDVSMSNFVYPAWFVLGSTGKLDFLGLIAIAQTMDAGGYEILMSADGTVNDVFAKGVEDGGMPEWKRAEKAKKAELPGSRHHKRKHHSASVSIVAS